MNKAEYVSIIEKALAGQVSPQELRDIVTYYRDYIDMEIGKGKSEEEVLEQLGNPRLLVKTILVAKEHEQSGEEENFQEEEKTKSFHIPMMVVVLLVVIVLCLVLSVAGLVLQFLFPVLVIWWLLSWILKRIK